MGKRRQAIFNLRRCSFGHLGVLLFPVLLGADHLPNNLITAGVPEVSLAGVRISKPFTTPDQLRSRWGKPASVEVPEGYHDRYVNYSWKVGEVLIETAQRDADHGPGRVFYSVVVAGTDPAGFLRTGRGLHLGHTLADVKRLYGTRIWVTRKVGGNLHGLIEWQDGTQMELDFNGAGSLVRIQLIAEE